MKFAGKVWRLLVGIKDGLVLVFMLLFFGVLFAALSARPNPGTVRDGALLLDLDGVIVEEVSSIDPFAALISQTIPVREYAARDLVRAIDGAAGDDRIKAIALDLKGFLGGGHVHTHDVASALGRFRAAGKPVYSYSLAYTDDAMMLAAQADEIWVDPLGGVAIAGPGGETLYYADALERFNINAKVYRAGAFKSLAEPFTRSSMSEEARANLTPLYESLWEEYQAAITKARPQANIALATGDIGAWLGASGDDAAKAALAAGLADKIGTREEWGARIAQEVGEDDWSELPGAFAATAFDPFLANIGNGLDLGSSGTVGVITIAGQIGDGDGGPGTAGALRIERLLNEALDDDLAGLVVRVDSPGGTVTGSETIRRAIARYVDKGIPVAVSMGNIAASGGYYVATPAQRIFAEPETITGSIGVILVVPVFEDLLSEYGIESDGIRTTGLSGQPDFLGGFTPDMEAVLQSSVRSNYAHFLGLVAESRGITVAQADELGQGRVFAGGTARQLGLIDQFGGITDAIAWVAGAAKLEEDGYGVRYLGAGETDMYGSLLAGLLGGDAAANSSGGDLAATITRSENVRLKRVIVDLQQLLGTQGVQARCLECSSLAQPPARTDAKNEGITRWLSWLN